MIETKQKCEHDWSPTVISFGKIEEVMCVKCGETQSRVRVTVEENPDFPWGWYNKRLETMKRNQMEWV